MPALPVMQIIHLAVFDVTGKRLSDEDLTTMLDTRGLWYNPATKLVCGNGHGDWDGFSYELDKTGIPTDIEDRIMIGMNQPYAQSVGVLQYYRQTGIIPVMAARYICMKAMEHWQIQSVIHWTRKKTDGADEDEDPALEHEDYNISSLVYTGIKGTGTGLPEYHE